MQKEGRRKGEGERIIRRVDEKTMMMMFKKRGEGEEEEAEGKK